MTQEFEGAGLTLIDRQYGLSGVETAQQTFLDDGNISQVIQVKDSARRARAPFGLGYFNIILENTHAVASELQSLADPYNPVNVHNGYPARIDPNLFEVWILDAQAVAGVGADVTWALIGYDAEAELQGISDTAAGGPVAPVDQSFYLGGWTDFTAFSLSTGVEVGTSLVRTAMPIRRRWLPGQPLLFRSLATGATSVTCVVTSFIGPVGLNQDLF